MLLCKLFKRAVCGILLLLFLTVEVSYAQDLKPKSNTFNQDVNKDNYNKTAIFEKNAQRLLTDKKELVQISSGKEKEMAKSGTWPEVRTAAIIYIGKKCRTGTCSADYYKVLQDRFLYDVDNTVKATAVLYYGILNDTYATDNYLVAIIKNDNFDHKVRSAAIKALGMMQNTKTVSDLTDLNDQYFTAGFISKLSSFDPSDEDIQLQMAVLESLASKAAESISSYGNTKTVPQTYLKKQMNSTSYQVGETSKVYSAVLLAALGDKDSIYPLKDLVSNSLVPKAVRDIAHDQLKNGRWGDLIPKVTVIGQEGTSTDEYFLGQVDKSNRIWYEDIAKEKKIEAGVTDMFIFVGTWYAFGFVGEGFSYLLTTISKMPQIVAVLEKLEGIAGESIGQLGTEAAEGTSVTEKLGTKADLAGADATKDLAKEATQKIPGLGPDLTKTSSTAGIDLKPDLDNLYPKPDLDNLYPNIKPSSYESSDGLGGIGKTNKPLPKGGSTAGGSGGSLFTPESETGALVKSPKTPNSDIKVVKGEYYQTMDGGQSYLKMGEGGLYKLNPLTGEMELLSVVPTTNPRVITNKVNINDEDLNEANSKSKDIKNSEQISIIETEDDLLKFANTTDPSTINVAGETHFTPNSKLLQDRLKERAANKEILLILEGTQAVAKHEWQLQTESDYVSTLSGLVEDYSLFTQNNLFKDESLYKMAFVDRYVELIYMYNAHSDFKAAFDKVNFADYNGGNDAVDVKKFLDTFTSNVQANKQGGGTINCEYDKVINAKNAPIIVYMIEKALLFLVNDEKYEKAYSSEFPDIAVPTNYKESIRKYLSLNTITQEDYDYLTNLLLLDWRNRILYSFIDKYISKKNDKPVYIVVGRNHLKDVGKHLKLKFGDPSKINLKFIAPEVTTTLPKTSNIKIVKGVYYQTLDGGQTYLEMGGDGVYKLNPLTGDMERIFQK